MKRVLLIINTFTKLLKLEHHHNFLESCNVVSVVPVGLRIKSCRHVLERSRSSLWIHGGAFWRSQNLNY